MKFNCACRLEIDTDYRTSTEFYNEIYTILNKASARLTRHLADGDIQHFGRQVGHRIQHIADNKDKIMT